MKNRLRLLALLTALLLTLGLFSGCGSDAAELLNSAASLAEQALDAAEAIENALPAQEALPESTDEPASPTEEIPEEAASETASEAASETASEIGGETAPEADEEAAPTAKETADEAASGTDDEAGLIAVPGVETLPETEEPTNEETDSLTGQVLEALFGDGEDAREDEEAEAPAAMELPEDDLSEEPEEAAPAIAKDGSYTTKEDLVLYIVTYGCLPENFITKKEAQALGWPGGSLEPYAPGCCIGGDRFGNYEGLLPKADGRTWTECDVDTLGAGSRGAKRLIFSNDGLIYYTDDHYESFTLEWGDPG